MTEVDTEVKPLYKVNFSYVQDSYVIVEATDEEHARGIIERNRDPDVQFSITKIDVIPEDEAEEYRRDYAAKTAQTKRTLN